MTINSLTAIASSGPLLFGNPGPWTPDHSSHEGELQTAFRLLREARAPLIYQGVQRLGSPLFKPADPAHRFAVLSEYDFSNIIRVLVRGEAIGVATAINPVLGFALAVAACDETILFQTPEDLCRDITENTVVPDGVHEWEIEGDNRHIRWIWNLRRIFCGVGSRFHIRSGSHHHG